MVYDCPLVQANARNKRLLFDGIDMLVDRNIASYSQALEFAYSGKSISSVLYRKGPGGHGGPII